MYIHLQRCLLAEGLNVDFTASVSLENEVGGVCVLSSLHSPLKIASWAADREAVFSPAQPPSVTSLWESRACACVRACVRSRRVREPVSSALCSVLAATWGFAAAFSEARSRGGAAIRSCFVVLETVHKGFMNKEKIFLKSQNKK